MRKYTYFKKTIIALGLIALTSNALILSIVNSPANSSDLAVQTSNPAKIDLQTNEALKIKNTSFVPIVNQYLMTASQALATFHDESDDFFDFEELKQYVKPVNLPHTATVKLDSNFKLNENNLGKLEISISVNNWWDNGVARNTVKVFPIILGDFQRDIEIKNYQNKKFQDNATVAFTNLFDLKTRLINLKFLRQYADAVGIADEATITLIGQPYFFESSGTITNIEFRVDKYFLDGEYITDEPLNFSLSIDGFNTSSTAIGNMTAVYDTSASLAFKSFTYQFNTSLIINTPKFIPYILNGETIPNSAILTVLPNYHVNENNDGYIKMAFSTNQIFVAGVLTNKTSIFNVVIGKFKLNSNLELIDKYFDVSRHEFISSTINDDGSIKNLSELAKYINISLNDGAKIIKIVPEISTNDNVVILDFQLSNFYEKGVLLDTKQIIVRNLAINTSIIAKKQLFNVITTDAYTEIYKNGAIDKIALQKYVDIIHLPPSASIKLAEFRTNDWSKGILAFSLSVDQYYKDERIVEAFRIYPIVIDTFCTNTEFQTKGIQYNVTPKSVLSEISNNGKVITNRKALSKYVDCLLIPNDWTITLEKDPQINDDTGEITLFLSTNKHYDNGVFKNEPQSYVVNINGLQKSFSGFAWWVWVVIGSSIAGIIVLTSLITIVYKKKHKKSQLSK